ncbi:MAG: ComF family protein [Spirochaetaceae bacterium]|nr:ComF family protein [Spirochaetaceae bacterium]
MNTIGPWTGPLREWLSALKYGGDTRMADWLSEILAEIWSENWSGVHLVPVPPRPARIFRSGIDPVGLLALGMRKRGIPVNRLLRRRGNRTQKNLSRRERLEEGALKYEIRLNARINQKEYVLLDDVSTTGTTLNVCARILKSAGAERVYGLVVCKD